MTYDNDQTTWGTIFKLTPSGKKSVLHRFGPLSRVASGEALILGLDGILYGDISIGGSEADCDDDNEGCGYVFKLTESGKFTKWFVFPGGADGGKPVGNLTQDAQGNLYGVGYYSENICGYAPCGMIFELGTDGKETVLYNFGIDGSGSGGGLALDAAGNLYGTGGGGTGCEPVGCGVIFELTP